MRFPRALGVVLVVSGLLLSCSNGQSAAAPDAGSPTVQFALILSARSAASAAPDKLVLFERYTSGATVAKVLLLADGATALDVAPHPTRSVQYWLVADPASGAKRILAAPRSGTDGGNPLTLVAENAGGMAVLPNGSAIVYLDTARNALAQQALDGNGLPQGASTLLAGAPAGRPRMVSEDGRRVLVESSDTGVTTTRAHQFGGATLDLGALAQCGFAANSQDIFCATSEQGGDEIVRIDAAGARTTALSLNTLPATARPAGGMVTRLGSPFATASGELFVRLDTVDAAGARCVRMGLAGAGGTWTDFTNLISVTTLGETDGCFQASRKANRYEVSTSRGCHGGWGCCARRCHYCPDGV